MSGRKAMLEKIAAANRDNPARQDVAAVAARIGEHRINLMPARADKPEPERLALFVEKCAELGVSVERLSRREEIPEAVAAFLQRHNLPAAIRLAPAPEIAGLDWARVALMQVSDGPGRITDQTSLTPAVAGIAETGALVLTSGAETPVTLNFVPDNHLVVLKRSRILRAMEDAFALLRRHHGAGELPRTVNLISGASRTGDVEQRIVMGAHGPRRLHLLLIDDGPARDEH